MLLFKDFYEEFYCERKCRILWAITLPILALFDAVHNLFGTFRQHLLCDVVISVDASRQTYLISIEVCLQPEIFWLFPGNSCSNVYKLFLHRFCDTFVH